MKCLLHFSLYLIVFLNILPSYESGWEKEGHFANLHRVLFPQASSTERLDHTEEGPELHSVVSQAPHYRASSVPKKGSSCLHFSSAAVFARLVDSQTVYLICLTVQMRRHASKGIELPLLLVTQTFSRLQCLFAHNLSVSQDCIFDAFMLYLFIYFPSSKLVNYLNSIISFTAGNGEGG